jgi:hypothetical protein
MPQGSMVTEEKRLENRGIHRGPIRIRFYSIFLQILSKARASDYLTHYQFCNIKNTLNFVFKLSVSFLVIRIAL